MKTRFLALIVISIILSASSCKEEDDDCLNNSDGIIKNEFIYVNIVDNKSENVFINNFYMDYLEIYENSQKLPFENANNIVKFQLSSDFYKYIDNISGDEVITYLYFHLAPNIVDTLTIKTTPKFYSEECDRTAYNNTKVIYKSKIIYENTESTYLLYTTHSYPLTLIRP